MNFNLAHKIRFSIHSPIIFGGSEHVEMMGFFAEYVEIGLLWSKIFKKSRQEYDKYLLTLEATLIFLFFFFIVILYWFLMWMLQFSPIQTTILTNYSIYTFIAIF